MELGDTLRTVAGNGRAGTRSALMARAVARRCHRASGRYAATVGAGLSGSGRPAVPGEERGDLRRSRRSPRSPVSAMRTWWTRSGRSGACCMASRRRSRPAVSSGAARSRRASSGLVQDFMDRWPAGSRFPRQPARRRAGSRRVVRGWAARPACDLRKEVRWVGARRARACGLGRMGDGDGRRSGASRACRSNARSSDVWQKACWVDPCRPEALDGEGDEKVPHRGALETGAANTPARRRCGARRGSRAPRRRLRHGTMTSGCPQRRSRPANPPANPLFGEAVAAQVALNQAAQRGVEQRGASACADSYDHVPRRLAAGRRRWSGLPRSPPPRKPPRGSTGSPVKERDGPAGRGHLGARRAGTCPRWAGLTSAVSPGPSSCVTSSASREPWRPRQALLLPFTRSSAAATLAGDGDDGDLKDARQGPAARPRSRAPAGTSAAPMAASGLPDPPGPPERVRDDHADVHADPRAQRPAGSGRAESSGSSGSSSTVPGRGVGRVHPGRGHHQAVPGLHDPRCRRGGPPPGPSRPRSRPPGRRRHTIRPSALLTIFEVTTRMSPSAAARRAAARR